MKKKYKILIFVLVVLFLTKIDYRQNSLGTYNPSDDASYQYHAYTIGLDFDLDYSNQIIQNTDYKILGFYENDEKLIPKHPLGAGILAAPFVFIGSIFNEINKIISFTTNDTIYFFYSMSSIFYLFLSINLLSKIINKLEHTQSLKPINLFILYVGSGVTYYAFERFSMSHIYEVFCATFLIYLTDLTYELKKSKYYYLVGFLSFFFITVRWTNYLYLLLPAFYLSIVSKENRILNFYLNRYYLSGVLTGIIAFMTHSKILYGVYTLNPKKIYRNNMSLGFLEKNNLDGYFDFDILLLFFNTYINLIFTKEFGLILFSPLLAALIYFYFKLFVNKEFKIFQILTLIISIPFGVIFLWQTTGSSYGFRYLSVLLPIAVLVIYRFSSPKFIQAIYYINIFSIFAFLKFETNELTSLREQINSFGVMHRFSAPRYLDGVLQSAFELDGYLKIFITSFLSLIIFKILISIVGIEFISDLIDRFGYLNSDVVEFLEYANRFSFTEVVLLILFYYTLSKKFIFERMKL